MESESFKAANGHHAESPDVCLLHIDLTTLLSGIQTDIKWLLRLGYGGMLIVITMIPILYFYSSGVGKDLVTMQNQIAVNTRAIETLGKTDQRFEQCVILIESAIAELKQNQALMMREQKPK